MERNAVHVALILITTTLLLCSSFSSTQLPCANCGRMPVPYPLSTGPNCGHQFYKVRCTAGSLWFDTVNGSAYMITSINPITKRFTVKPESLSINTCISSDFRRQGVQLNSALPFSITSSNTILLLNCSVQIVKLHPPIECSTPSVCHSYIKDKAVACKSGPNCCAFKGGGPLNGYRIEANNGGCSAYQSFVNLDVKKPVKSWPEPGLEIEWALPQEPDCKTDLDCKGVLFSKCFPVPARIGQKKCFCNAGYKWDPINGSCENPKCHKLKACKKRKKKTALFAGAAVSGVAVAVVIVIGVLFYNNQNQPKRAQKNLIKERKEILHPKNYGKSTRIFTGKEIKKATNNFSKDNLIGSGGFGEVFKGYLEDGTITAIKRAKLGNTKGTDQVLNEVRILCQVNHRSLVRLLGCCVDLELPIMIYEYIPNGTLFDHLHSHHTGKWTPLSWQRRLQIAHQTAEGLTYLHSAAMPPIYHRDVKSSNILLDEKLNAKVSDFGLSRLVDTTENKDSHIFTSAQGTLGYLDPEYYQNFQLTDKSDVYSFGVVLLEVLTSKRAIDFNREEENVNLVVYMKKVMDEDKLLEVIDPVIKENATKLELETMKEVGALAAACLNEKRQNRPTMKEVADEIEYIIGIATGKVTKIT